MLFGGGDQKPICRGLTRLKKKIIMLVARTIERFLLAGPYAADKNRGSSGNLDQLGLTFVHFATILNELLPAIADYS